MFSREVIRRPCPAAGVAADERAPLVGLTRLVERRGDVGDADELAVGREGDGVVLGAALAGDLLLVEPHQGGVGGVGLEIEPTAFLMVSTSMPSAMT